MIEIDTITIICSAAVLLSAVITSFFSPFIRKPAVKEDEDANDSITPLSVVMIAHDCASFLRENLPKMLTQDYPAGYEVIVVTGKSEDDTEDILKSMKAEYPHLYTTFIPDSSRYMSRAKLSVTLGVKAAKNEWIILTDPTCQPLSDKWLKSMAAGFDEDHDIVMGYSNYDEETPDFRRFERLYTELYLEREAQKGTAYRTASRNLAFRKSVFMRNNGFIRNLKFERGEYDFIVNEYAEKHKTVVANSPSAQLLDTNDSKRMWKAEQLTYMSTRKHLDRSAFHRLVCNTDTLLLHANIILIIAAVIYSAMTQNWILLGAAVAALLYTVICKTVAAKKISDKFDAALPSAKLYLFELGMVWHRLRLMMRYSAADKADFIRTLLSKEISEQV